MKQILLICAVVMVGCETSAPQSQPKAPADPEKKTPPLSPKATPTTEAEKKAFAETKAKAERGDVRSQYNLGQMYHKGDGVKQDFAQAVAWFTKAAEQNDRLWDRVAQTKLGFMYREGDGVKQDFAQAVAWFTKAAEQNVGIAQFVLGSMYQLGEGTDKDMVQGLAWWLLAAKQGDKNAIKLIPFARVSMTRGQINQAKALSEKLLRP